VPELIMLVGDYKVDRLHKRKPWEHINLTGDYQWRNAARLRKSKFRPLRQP
jgi:hypothetical protein